MKYSIIIESDNLQELLDLISPRTIPVTLEETTNELKPVTEPEPVSLPAAKTWVKGEAKHEINCAVCGKAFMPFTLKSKFCSKKCYMKDYWNHYKKPVVPDPVPVSKDPETIHDKSAIQLLEEHIPEIPTEKDRICKREGCTNRFVPERVGTEFCSKRCYMMDYRLNHKEPAKPKVKKDPAPKIERHFLGSPNTDGQNYKIIDVNGKPTQIFGTPEKIERFMERLKEQDDNLRRKHVKATETQEV